MKLYNLEFKYSVTMRTLLSLSAILLVFGLYSCDKVSNPLIDKGNNAVIPVVPPTHVDSTSSTDDALVKVLLEDYTAHHCTNCPATSAQFETLLKGPNANQAVFMECNIGSLAQSYSPTAFGINPADSAYYTYYVNLADSEWNNTFIKADVNGWPGTMADRLYYNGTAGSSDLSLNGIDFNTPFDSLIATPQTARIHIADSMYIPPTNTVSMSITTTLLSPQAGVKYYLVVTLVEDSIFDWQDSSSVDVQYYLKRMTIRTAINDGGHGFGDTLSNTTAPQTIHYAYASPKFRYNSTLSVPPVVPPRYWNMAHMYVVAFVYQRTSGKNDYLVLQAQKLHL